MAPAGLTVIVGEEVKTLGGDLICLFLERPIPPGLAAVDAIAAARDQGALVGHPAPVRPAPPFTAQRRVAWHDSSRWSTGSRRTTPG